jgi:hypothetical protein
MEISLKRVKYAAFASEETPCFSAKVYVDGKLLCEARNDGHGGSDMLHPAKGRTHAEIVAVDKALKASAVKPVKMDDLDRHIWDDGYRPGLEEAVHDALYNWLYTRDLKRRLTKNVLISVDGRILVFKTPYSDKVRDQILKKHPAGRFLNSMDFSEALSLYRNYMNEAPAHA